MFLNFRPQYAVRFAPCPLHSCPHYGSVNILLWTKIGLCVNMKIKAPPTPNALASHVRRYVQGNVIDTARGLG